MTAGTAPTPTTRAEAIRNAGEVLGAILADPDRREQIRRDLAARDANHGHQAAPNPK